MEVRVRIVLKQCLSPSTVESVCTYLNQFGNERHVVELIERGVRIYVDEGDAALLTGNFASVISSMEPVR